MLRRRQEPGREQQLAVERFEWVPAGPDVVLLRLAGRWSPAAPEQAELVIAIGEAETQARALPGAPPTAPDEPHWRGAFAAPAELVDDAGASFYLRVPGTTDPQALRRPTRAPTPLERALADAEAAHSALAALQGEMAVVREAATARERAHRDKMAELDAEMAQLRAELAEAREAPAQRDAMAARNADLEAELAEVRAQLAEAGERVAEAEAELRRRAADVPATEGVGSLERRRMAEVEEVERLLVRSDAALRGARRQVATDLRGLGREAGELEDDLARLRADLAEHPLAPPAAATAPPVATEIRERPRRLLRRRRG